MTAVSPSTLNGPATVGASPDRRIKKAATAEVSHSTQTALVRTFGNAGSPGGSGRAGVDRRGFCCVISHTMNKVPIKTFYTNIAFFEKHISNVTVYYEGAEASTPTLPGTAARMISGLVFRPDG